VAAGVPARFSQTDEGARSGDTRLVFQRLKEATPMTYSIAGMCRRTGMFGVAVTTSSISVGSRCAFAKAGVGAMLSQHCTDPRLGTAGIEMLEQGKTAKEVMEALALTGPEVEHRQLAIIDRTGATGFFHGKRIRSTHNNSERDACVAIGNIIKTTVVTEAMVETFASRPEAHLAERLMAALEAGYDAGGETRQEKSASLLVVHEHSFPLVDLRVDYDANAIGQLRFIWDNYVPQMNDYVQRAIDPEGSQYWVPKI
jgi:uncharacterized Ntn-hydrolase superfamily protein